jgi:hypothetical protein
LIGAEIRKRRQAILFILKLQGARMAALRMFIPITKVDVPQRLAYGLATAETADQAGEICDYASTKPLYEKWSQAISRSTRGKSLGNLRAMHRPVAAGKITKLNFNDEAKQIEICAKIVDDSEWAKVEEGVYTGFSQGGAYARRWTDAEGLTRYTAAPTEISLVDTPCLPEAQFEMVKADGAVEVRRFASPLPSPFEPLFDELECVEVAAGKDGVEVKAATVERIRSLISRASALLRALGVAETDAPSVSVDQLALSPELSPKPEKILSEAGCRMGKASDFSDHGSQPSLQQIHDLAVELGALCGVEKATGLHLEKRLAALVECMSEMSGRLQRIEEQPLPLPFAGRLRPIHKHEDHLGQLPTDDGIDGLLADPQALSILAIKMAQRNRRAPPA